MRNTKTAIIALAVVTCAVAAAVFFAAAAVHAQVSIDFPTNFAGFSTQDLKTTITNIVRIVIGFVGIIFLILLLYGGLVWMTSGGSERQIERAKKIIVSAVVGLLITLTAYAIASFLIGQFERAARPGGGPGRGPGGFPGGFALGAGVLESHYPGRGATGIPRNTNILVTFKEDIDATTVCSSGGTTEGGSIRIEDTTSAAVLDPSQVACSTADLRTFKFDPVPLLGNASGDTVYRVTLTSNILKKNLQQALPLGYSWQFTVSTFIDETPPTVTSVYPEAGSTVPRNSVVQINFSEAIDPTTASGITPPFSSIAVYEDGRPVEGTYRAANQYRTTEFVTNEACGTNSCGLKVYCLPISTLMSAIVTPNVTDMAGNRLDGDGDGAAGGDYSWDFDTSDTLDLTAPIMIKRAPTAGMSDADVYKPVEALFNKRLSAATIVTNNAGLSRRGFTDISITGDPIGFWVSKEDGDGNSDGKPDTKIFIHHETFAPLQQYHPGVDSDIQDLSQNCYFPAVCDNNGDGVGSPAECTAPLF